MTNKEIKVHNVVSLQYVPKYSLPCLVPHLANPFFFFGGGGGVQGWSSGESTRLPPMWPGFDSQTQRHMWVEFVGSLLCTERYSGFPLSLFELICVNCPQLVLASARTTRHLNKVPFLSFPFASKALFLSDLNSTFGASYGPVQVRGSLS